MDILNFLFNNQPALDLMRNQPVLTLFLMLGCGYLLGNIKFGSFSLGPVAGVLFVGLFLGHHGFEASPGAQSVGFALFIFSVGYQAGPRFFDVLITDGLRYKFIRTRVHLYASAYCLHRDSRREFLMMPQPTLSFCSAGALAKVFAFDYPEWLKQTTENFHVELSK